jgi:uncharacterized glyoxalase superfamily protein PhnB
MQNRSIPADVILPHITYQDVAAALAWLSKAFGFTEHFRYGQSPDGQVQGAQLHLGEAWIMLNSPRTGRSTPAQLGAGTQSLTIFIEDVDAHYARAKSAGVKIMEDLHETEYGERQYCAQDPEGHQWIFSRHAKDVAPSDWGAITR